MKLANLLKKITIVLSKLEHVFICVCVFVCVCLCVATCVCVHVYMNNMTFCMCGGGGGLHAATEINLRLPALQFMAASNARETQDNVQHCWF